MRILGFWSVVAAIAFCASHARADELSSIVAPGAKVEKIAHGYTK